MADTSIVLVHGAWHGGWCWERVVPLLEEAGLAVTTVDLPSSGGTGDVPDDARVIRAAVEAQGGPVVLVGHSYGGIAISEASVGLAAVQQLVYVCAFQLDVGESLLGVLQNEVPPWIDVDGAAGVSRVNDPVFAFYADVDEETAAACTVRLNSQTLSSFGTAQTGAGWQEHPSTYLACTQDNAIPYPAQQAMSARAGTVHTIESSHSPFLSHPQEVADLLLGITGR